MKTARNSVPTTKEEWLRQKVSAPTTLRMSEEGDLVTSMEPAATVIPLQSEVLAEGEGELGIHYIHMKLQERSEKRIQAEKIYIEARRNLIDVLQSYKNNTSSIDNVIEANKEVHNAECKLNQIRKGIREVVKIEGMKGFELHEDTPYDVTKIPEPVLAGRYTTFPLNYFWMEKPAVEEVPVEEEEEPPQQEGGKREKTQEEKDRARKWAIINARRKHH